MLRRSSPTLVAATRTASLRVLGRPTRRRHRVALSSAVLLLASVLGAAPPEHYVQGALRYYMRQFEDGEEISVEPWRAAAFPLLRDLVVDRSAFDRIMQAGGYISVHSGPKPEPNSIPIENALAEEALDAACCIGCGACVAACPNGAAMLYTAAKVSHLGILPQGQPERYTRVTRMVAQMEHEGFGSCRNYAECEAACPKEISIKFIGRMNRDYLTATLRRPIKRDGPMDSQ